MSLRILDLYCKAGGAALGYHQAGFDVVGVDIEPQPHYPFDFIQSDALTVDLCWSDFDAIHASPPCQDHSALSSMAGTHNTGWLLEATRELLETTGLPYVIENVMGAPMRGDVILCGTMFGCTIDNAELWRHRQFEVGGGWQLDHWLPQCAHGQRRHVLGVYGHADGEDVDRHRRRTRRGWTGSTSQRAEVMGIGWMTSAELAQAIPPAYTKWIGSQLITHLEQCSK